MLCIKIFGNNGSVISAEIIDDPVYVCYQTINKIIVRCSEAKAQGVVSQDGSQIYLLKGRQAMPGDYLLAEETSQADCEAIIDELQISDELPKQRVSDDETAQDDTSIMTAVQMRERIIELERQAQERDEQIVFLEDCLLEMSEVLYE